MNFSYASFFFFKFFFCAFSSSLRANFNIGWEQCRAGSCTKIRAEFLYRTLKGFGPWKRLVEQHGDIFARLFGDLFLYLSSATSKQYRVHFAFFFSHLCPELFSTVKRCARDLYIFKNIKLKGIEQKCINFCY